MNDAPAEQPSQQPHVAEHAEPQMGGAHVTPTHPAPSVLLPQPPADKSATSDGSLRVATDPVGAKLLVSGKPAQVAQVEADADHRHPVGVSAVRVHGQCDRVCPRGSVPAPATEH